MWWNAVVSWLRTSKLFAPPARSTASSKENGKQAIEELVSIFLSAKCHGRG